MTSRTKWLGQFPFGPYSPECVERPFAEACLNRGKLEIEAQSRCRNRRSPMRGRLQQQPPLTPAPQHSPLVGDRLPHHLGPLDDQLRRPVFLRAYLPNAHTQRVVEPAVTLIFAEVSRADYYLPPTNRVGSTVAAIVEEDLRPVVGLDDPLKVGQESSITATVWVVGPSEESGDASLAASLGQEEEPTFGAIRTCQVRAPASGVGEPDTVQRLPPHSAPPRLDDPIDRSRIVRNSISSLPPPSAPPEPATYAVSGAATAPSTATPK